VARDGGPVVRLAPLVGLVVAFCRGCERWTEIEVELETGLAVRCLNCGGEHGLTPRDRVDVRRLLATYQAASA
jgi:hypothetical protein